MWVWSSIMDLSAYEKSKFGLAEILRSASALLPREEHDHHRSIRDLQARLADDRFNLVVVGRFSRGKTSLMNAVLGMDRLPTGIVPLTSVITTVTYGSKEHVVLQYQDRGFRSQIALAELPKYITQAGNPGNVKRIKVAEVHLPAEILRRGFFFVDTPGLGSPIPENTRTTEDFLPEADAFLLVTGYESPLSEDEVRFLRGAVNSARRIFFVLNKQDTVCEAEREQALTYVQSQLRSLFGPEIPLVFSISARDGLEAKLKDDPQLLESSGLLRLEEALARFLLSEKNSEFMLQMCNRIADMLLELGQSAELSGMLQQVSDLKISLFEGKPDAHRYIPAGITETAAEAASLQFRPCEICERIQQHAFRFLSRYQYELATNPGVQRDHAERGGFCSLHTWQYESIASPQGTCSAYPALLNRLSAWFAHEASMDLTSQGVGAAMGDLIATVTSCPVCKLRSKSEEEGLASVVHTVSQESIDPLGDLSAICLIHLRSLTARLKDSTILKQILGREAFLLQRVSEDMQRYSLRHDALRRSLTSDEERDASLKALLLLVGHRSVSSPWRVESIL
jgi:GTP-binding protein EngB required for normal cell division